MKAILLAAGRGTRISKRIEEVPKCTLPIAGKPLVRRTVEMMLSVGIEPIVAVGYKADHIYQALEGLDVKFYYNPFFDVTNSIASLWFAQSDLNEDLIVMNADVYFSMDLLKRIIADERPVVMASDRSRTAVGDYFFALGPNNAVVKYGKDLPLEERSAEYVGLAKVSSAFLPAFKDRLHELIDSQRHGCWWEDILYSYTDTGEHEIHTMDVDGDFWSEIDFFDDYERILHHIDVTGEGKDLA